MAANKRENQLLLLVEQENADQAFWCEPVDLADGEESASQEKESYGCGQCGCACSCNCSCS